MKPKRSLHCSQEPDTGPDSQPHHGNEHDGSQMKESCLICSMFHALIRCTKFIKRPKNALGGGPYVIKLHSQIQVHLLVFLINFTKESSFKSNSIMKSLTHFLHSFI